jgi:chaperone required for assembly of F1-ATPase
MIVNFNTDKDFLSQQKDHHIKPRRLPATTSLTANIRKNKAKTDLISQQLWAKMKADHMANIPIVPQNYEEKLFNADFNFYNKIFHGTHENLHLRCDNLRDVVKRASEKVNSPV